MPPLPRPREPEVRIEPRADRSVTTPADPNTVDQEIARLETLDLPALRVQFRNRTGRIAPARISRPLLVRVLAYRIQAERFGDLRPDVRRLLDRMGAEGAAASDDGGTGKAISAQAPASARPKRGTVLVREWQGRIEHVMVLDDGFAWNGTTYPSLSAVARAITGTKWNGRRFFGLDRQESASSKAGEAYGRGDARDSGKQGREQNSNTRVARSRASGDACPPPGRGHRQGGQGSAIIAEVAT